MVKYLSDIERGYRHMEDKTLLEELLERSPDERMHKRKMDKAYQLMTMGFRDEADALFDEILAEAPFNRDAMTGKKLIERQKGASALRPRPSRSSSARRRSKTDWTISLPVRARPYPSRSRARLRRSRARPKKTRPFASRDSSFCARRRCELCSSLCLSLLY